MALSKDALQQLYRSRAKHYDFTANLYYLIGFRESRYRKQAVAALGLRSGDRVVDIGCGTGLNFAYLHDAVGKTGWLVGVDLSELMLNKAERRVERKHWKNVNLVTQDAATYQFPDPMDGVISTFALTLVPEYERVIANAAKALKPGKRLVVLDLKLPDQMPLWLIWVAIQITKPFGVTFDLANRKPWEAMENHFQHVSVTELYGGFAYIAVGAKGARIGPVLSRAE